MTCQYNHPSLSPNLLTIIGRLRGNLWTLSVMTSQSHDKEISEFLNQKPKKYVLNEFLQWLIMRMSTSCIYLYRLVHGIVNWRGLSRNLRDLKILWTSQLRAFPLSWCLYLSWKCASDAHFQLKYRHQLTPRTHLDTSHAKFQ